MLKLLRIENTNMFIVISEEEFIKKMRIEAIVRIEENSCDDAIRRYEPQTPQWHEELDKLKEIKRKELYSSEKKDRKTYVSLVEILINYFNASEKSYISVKHLYDLTNFIHNSLQYSEMLQNYNANLDLDLEGIERVLLYYANIFATTDKILEMNSIIYYITSYEKRNKITEKYIVDETITSIIKTFVEKNG